MLNFPVKWHEICVERMHKGIAVLERIFWERYLKLNEIWTICIFKNWAIKHWRRKNGLFIPFARVLWLGIFPDSPFISFGPQFLWTPLLTIRSKVAYHSIIFLHSPYHSTISPLYFSSAPVTHACTCMYAYVQTCACPFLRI